MPAPTKGARLGGSPSHERIILANLATQLFEHGRIVTTEAKAKRLRPLAEKLITKAKRGDINSRRLVLTTVKDKGVVHTLFTEIAPSMDGREGGYTRITKVGPRKGDNAPMALSGSKPGALSLRDRPISCSLSLTSSIDLDPKLRMSSRSCSERLMSSPTVWMPSRLRQL